MAIRCVYTDLDGTMLGKRRLPVPDRGRRVHAAGRAGARGLPSRRRRGRDHLRAPPRAGDGGRPPDRAELVHLRGGHRHGDRRRADLPHRRSAAPRGRQHPRADRRVRRARSAAASLRRTGSTRTCPLRWIARSRICSAGDVDAGEANGLLAERGPRGPAARRQRLDRAGHARLPPDPRRLLEGERRGGAHARARLRARAVHRRGRLARGPRARRGGRPHVPRGQLGGRRLGASRTSSAPRRR